MLNLGLKAEKQLQNENRTEDWALQSCAKIIEKTVKNGLLSLATSNLKLFLRAKYGEVEDNIIIYIERLKT